MGFNKNVTLEDGIYFNDSFEDDNSIENMLTGVQQQEKIYTVRAGDTLWAIAQKNDLTFRELCALNTNFKGAPLTENSNIQEGDQLIVTKQEALLEVRITKVETREEEIPFGTETTQSNEYTKVPPRPCRKARTACAASPCRTSTIPMACCWSRPSFPLRPSVSR